jgi:hypothetical protein
VLFESVAQEVKPRGLCAFSKRVNTGRIIAKANKKKGKEDKRNEN